MIIVMLVESKRSSHFSFTLSLHDNMSMNIVPADVLLEIADYLSCPSEILHLYLTVRANNYPMTNAEWNQH
jgi:hypothetical protein